MPRDKLIIALEAGHAHYLPGDVIRGKLEVITKKEQAVAELKIKLDGTTTMHGTADKVRFTGNEAAVDDTLNQQIPKHTKKIMDFTTILLGDGVKDNKLAAGKTTFNFVFQLPHGNLPPSCKNEHNTVEYVLRATLKRPGWYFGNPKTSQEINVQNDEIETLGWSNLKQMAFLCSGHFSGYIRLDPGSLRSNRTTVVQVRLTELNIDSKIERGSASLVEETTVVSGARIKQFTKEIASINLAKDPDNGKSWKGNLKIFLASVENENKSIQKHYSLKLKAKAHGYVYLVYPCQLEERLRSMYCPY